MVKQVESTKLFYKKYPYKISYIRLYGFPTTDMLSAYWWFDYPTSKKDMSRRKNCLQFLKSLVGTKFANSSFTHVYFEDKETFECALGRFEDLQREVHYPFIDNLEETLQNQKQRVEIKNSLYHKKYRYKIDLKCDDNLEHSLGPALVEMYIDHENYFLNTNMRKFAETDPIVTSVGSNIRYGYVFRHSNYNVYTVYCKEYIDMELMAFVTSENIIKITKALLKSELDK
jgi:hypothetical protein|tara:strand:- start:1378 stop:2064 length:687 start_codon:yes stop_codon:yes gene_type:complete